MKTPEKLDAKTAIKELTTKHGLDYLNARNLLYGKKFVTRKELSGIIERIDKSQKVTLKTIKRRPTSARRKASDGFLSNENIYDVTKQYVIRLAEKNLG